MSCLEGNWGWCTIKVSGNKLRGYWNSQRPSFTGVCISQSQNVWHFNFPDDRIYTAQVYDNQQVLDWGNPHTVWYRDDLYNRESLSGEWPQALIYVVGSTLQGKWKDETQPDFIGQQINDIQWSCTVWNNQRMKATFVRNCVVIDFGPNNLWFRRKDPPQEFHVSSAEPSASSARSATMYGQGFLDGIWHDEKQHKVTVISTQFVFIGSYTDSRRLSGIRNDNEWLIRFPDGKTKTMKIVEDGRMMEFNDGIIWVKEINEDDTLLSSAVTNLMVDEPPPYTRF